MSVIARVNQEEIDDKSLDAAVRRYIVQLEEEEEEDNEFEMTEVNIKYLKAEVLNQLIERRLMIQGAMKNHIAVSEKEVLSRVNALKSEFNNLQEWENNLLAVGSSPDEVFIEVQEDLLLEQYLESLMENKLDFSEEELKRYFEDHQNQMKEPDLYSFYEVFVNGSDEVNEAAFILNNAKNISEIQKDFSARSMQFEHYLDIPASRLPEEIYNVLSDLKEEKIGTMLAGGTQLIVYQLKKKQLGKKFEYKELKGKLGGYLKSQGRKEILSRVVNQALDEADIEYVDISSAIEGKNLHKKQT